MLDEVNKALRINQNNVSFDSEIRTCIDYVEQDLWDLGIRAYDENNPRIINLTILYARYYFNFDNKGDFYLKEYERLRNQISMQGVYKE